LISQLILQRVYFFSTTLKKKCIKKRHQNQWCGFYRSKQTENATSGREGHPMGTVTGSINPNVGPFGQKAALTYQALKPMYHASTPVQYTPDIQAKGASHDLFAYAQTFAQNPNDFTTQEIKAASGLDLHQLAKPDTLKTLWDTDKNGKVDLKEAFVGLAHLDSADGAFDGKITQEGRQEIARLFFEEGVKQRIKPFDYHRQAVGLTGSAERLKDLGLEIANATQQAALPTDLLNESVDPYLKLLANQTGQLALMTYPLHVQQQIATAQEGYRQILSQVGQALDVTERFHGYQCACCPAA
jgi:hypothetical protein